MAEKTKKPAAEKTYADEKPETKKPAPKKADDESEKTVAVPKESKKGNATGLRIGAIVCWVVALAFEILTILVLNGTLYVGDIGIQTALIIGLAADLVFVIVGSQLWKAANHRDPASKADKVKFWLWNNMGVLVSVVCFFPIIIMLLRDKNLEGKSKKLVTIIAVVALLIAGVSSYDFNPVSKEDFEEQAKAAAVETGGSADEIYWTRFGKSYHLDRNCQALSRTTDANLFNGTLDEAFDAKRTDPCDFCANGGAQKTAEVAPVDAAA